MTIEEIRTQADEWVDLNPCRLYQGRLANVRASHVAHLLRVVEALAGRVSKERNKYRPVPAEVEYWVKWADAKAREEGSTNDE